VIANYRVWLDFFGNPHVRATPGLKQAIDSQSPMSFPLPGLPGVIGFSDCQTLPNNVAVVGCRNAPSVALIDGPTESALYRKESMGGETDYMTHWLQPLLTVPGSIRKITGVHA
jgi:hypothetical protein